MNKRVRHNTMLQKCKQIKHVRHLDHWISDHIWRNLADLAKKLNSLSIFVGFLGKTSNLFWQIFYAIGQIFIAVDKFRMWSKQFSHLVTLTSQNERTNWWYFFVNKTVILKWKNYYMELCEQRNTKFKINQPGLFLV